MDPLTFIGDDRSLELYLRLAPKTVKPEHEFFCTTAVDGMSGEPGIVDRVFHRDHDGWREYPPYPTPPEAE